MGPFMADTKPINISHAPKRPETTHSSRPGDPRKKLKHILFFVFLGTFYIRIQLNFQAVIKSAASAASLRSEIGGSGPEKKLCTLPRSKP